MPNPTPGPSNSPGPLRKFTLHAASLTAPGSPISQCLSSTGPLAPTTLDALKLSLRASRSLASDRIVTRDGNRRNLVERQAIDKKALDEGARLKEFERKRKRDEEEKRERDRLEKIEKDKFHRDKEEFEKKKEQDALFERVRIKEEEEKRIADEREREAAVKRAREEKEKRKMEQVLSIVRGNAGVSEGVNGVSKTGDLELPPQDVAPAAPPPTSTSLHSTPSSLPTSKDISSKPGVGSDSEELAHQVSLAGAPVERNAVSVMVIQSSPEPDEDDGQPRPPIRHKSDLKKRKRDQILDSDASDSNQDADGPAKEKIRKLVDDNSEISTPLAPPPTTPLPTVVVAPPPPKDPYEGLTPIQRKLKDEKFIKHSIPTRAPAPGTATAFYLPSHSLVPPKPVSIAPTPTPKKQSEVSEDFSKAKPGTQIAHHTFHTWAEAYLRPFGEDDLAFLAPSPDDITPYIIPPLGKHFLDRWEEEDAEVPIASTSYVSALEPPPLPRLRPDSLTEDTLGTEAAFVGPLSERLIAALAFVEGGDLEEVEDKVMNDSEEMAPTRSNQIDAVELEERIKKELRFIGLLPEEDIDWTTREDDEVSSALRACQRLLQKQTALNEARKIILSSIVKDRMAYQDYEATRDAQERIIENGWNKRQRAGKKKVKGKEREKVVEGPKPPVSLALLSAIEKRRKLVHKFKPFFEEEEDKGRFFGIPQSSVFFDDEHVGLE